jgi:N-hydroxyarylamine O-acetyltransferase
LGPEYDHMSIYVKTDKDYLADVGFGDLFVRPLEIRAGIQNDGRNYFKIEKYTDKDYLLSMSADGMNYQSKYTFNLTEAPISSFDKICFDKQTNPDSYFVKNTICTKPTDTGRLTLFNNKLIEKTKNDRFETVITNDKHWRDQLRNKFGIQLM